MEPQLTMIINTRMTLMPASNNSHSQEGSAMSNRNLEFKQQKVWICFFLMFTLAPPTAGISASCSSSASGETATSLESFSLDSSTSLQESLALGSGSISMQRQAEGKGNNSIQQTISGTKYTMQNDIESQGEFAATSSTSASAQSATVNQNIGGSGSLSLGLVGKEGARDAVQEANVRSGSLVSSHSLSAGEGISARQSTEIQGLEGGVLAGALGSDNVMVAKGSFEGLGSMKADLGATTQDQASITGTASIDGAPLLSGHTFRALSLNDEGRGVGISGLRMVDGGLGNFDVSVINSDLNDASGRPYASKEYNPIASSGGSSSSYVLNGFRWNQENPNIQLYLNPTDIPPGIKAESARDAISAAANTWDGAVHKNLFTDKSTVIIDYSKEVPNPFSGDYRADGINTNGFRNFGNNYLAVSIFWTDLKKEDGYYSTIESDILYNLDFKWTDDLKQAESSGRLDLQSVAVHELGHTIGLDDLYTLDNSDARKYDFDQVMNLYNGPQRTLGNGDKAGAQALYGIPLSSNDPVSKAKYGWTGSTLAGSTNWVQYDENSIYADVDTIEAGFTETPLYFASIGGNSGHWSVDGVNAIYSPTATGFRIYLRDDLGNPLTPDITNEQKWYIQWKGIPNTENIAGSTTVGGTDWKQYGSNSIYVDVDTTNAGFIDTPLYFTSIGGNYRHWEVDGINAIYSPTKTGFRIYLRDDLSDYLTPELANQMGWNIQWLGVQKTDCCAGSTAYKATDWNPFDVKSIYLDIASNTGLIHTPMYLTSLAGDYRHWEVDGINAIYTTTSEGLRIYLRDDLSDYLTPELANQMGWKLQWAAN